MNKNIKNKVEELIKATPRNVGVAYGKKMKNGKFTGELGIIFTVEKKKPLGELLKSEILPSTVEIGGEEHKTDVIEIGKMRPLVSCYPSLGTCVDCNSATVNPCFRTWCPDYYDPHDPAHDNTYYIDNWDKQTYLSGGIQISSNNNFPVGGDNGGVGTLGMIAVDNDSGALVGVTNNHVIIGNAFYTTYRDIDNVENEGDDTVYQNLSVVGNEVGKVMRYVPLKKTLDENNPTFNSVDGAIFYVNSSSININESYKQFGLSYTSPMAFATTTEIDDLLDTDPLLYSSGRTTGPKEGVLCGLTALTVSAPVLVGPYNDGGVEFGVDFNKIIVFTRTDPQCPYPIAAGDSGSALIADFDGTWKIIGLCFAGGEFFGAACRIDEVASQLDISAWNGTAKPYINVASKEIITLPGQSSLKTTTCNGKTYWQVGATNISQPCT